MLCFRTCRLTSVLVVTNPRVLNTAVYTKKDEMLREIIYYGSWNNWNHVNCPYLSWVTTGLCSGLLPKISSSWSVSQLHTATIVTLFGCLLNPSSCTHYISGTKSNTTLLYFIQEMQCLLNSSEAQPTL